VATDAGLEPGARRLLRLAVAALARREHSRAEIERKLLRRLLPEEQAQDVALALDQLQARGLLSDQRMAEALVRTRATRYGRLRIAQELDRRGVDRDTITATLPAAADEAALAAQLWRRKFGQLPATPLDRARQARFLAARGFSAAVIGRILSVGADELSPDGAGDT
jgi:regulatory protein